jgi:hypothetical protein
MIVGASPGAMTALCTQERMDPELARALVRVDRERQGRCEMPE